MKPVQKLLAVAAAGLLGALFVPKLGDAQVPGRPESTLTITERTEVPGGVVLEPGSYVVKVLDTQSDWNVVAIQNPDMTRTFATVLATPHTATSAIPNTTFVFYNTPEGQPKVLRSWFPPNDRYGQDFVYSKERGEELARLTKEQVPEETAEMQQSLSSRESAPGSASSQTTTTTAENNTSETSTTPATSAENAGSTWRSDTGAAGTATPETTTAENTATTNGTGKQLPRTASPFPLLALAGAASIGLGFAVRRYAA